MQILHRNGRIVGTATDAYTGPELTVDAPEGFDVARMDQYVVDEVEGGFTLRDTFDFQAFVVAQTQARLDAFAQTRNYDGILSACTYATSTVPKFQIEGQYSVDARDQTWAALYALMADVQAGTTPAPTSWAEVEAILPTLSWPAMS